MELFGIAENPIPNGAVSGYFRGYDGVRLRYARWHSLEGPGRGTVCIFTGRGEFIEKYFETISDLRRRGFHVAIMDWAGQGRSARLTTDRHKGHIDNFRHYERDVRIFLDQIVLPDCPPPLFALAHSMGGTVVLHYAADARPVWFERIVLAAPMIRMPRKKLPLPIIKFLLALAYIFGLSRSYIPGGGPKPDETGPFEVNDFTSDRERYARNAGVLKAAPLMGIGSPTLGWLRAAIHAMDKFHHPEFTDRIKTPVMMVAAGGEKVVSRRATEVLGHVLPAGGCVTIDGALHDLLSERDEFREQFWAAFDAFITDAVKD